METKRKWKNLTRKLINLATSVFASVVFRSHAITQVSCNAVALAVTVKQKFATNE